jgi:hypothetical protein
VVDLDTTLGQQLLDVAVRQAEPQVPTDREDDDIGWKRKPAKADRVAEQGEGSEFSYRQSRCQDAVAADATVPLDETAEVGEGAGGASGQRDRQEDGHSHGEALASGHRSYSSGGRSGRPREPEPSA